MLLLPKRAVKHPSDHCAALWPEIEAARIAGSCCYASANASPKKPSAGGGTPHSFLAGC